jgi:hypothetical protein
MTLLYSVFYTVLKRYLLFTCDFWLLIGACAQKQFTIIEIQHTTGQPWITKEEVRLNSDPEQHFSCWEML